MIVITVNLLITYEPIVFCCFSALWLSPIIQSFNHRLDMVKKDIDHHEKSRERMQREIDQFRDDIGDIKISISAISRIESDMEEVRSEIKRMKEMQS